MILFFGTRRGKQTAQPLSGIICPHCGQTNTMTAHSQVNWFHVFWIKLFKISTSRFSSCSHCKGVFDHPFDKKSSWTYFL